MSVTSLYFAGLRETLGKASETLVLTPDLATVAAVRGHLVARGGAYATSLDAKRAVRAAVNQDMIRGDAPIKSGDEIAFFPPVTGG